VARILIVGGGCRGRQLAAALTRAGDVVRITTRSDARRADIEAAGAECWVGTPDRLETLRGALDRVAVLCWLMGSASGAEDELRALHTERLRFFITQAIDTTVRGVVYEAVSAGTPQALLDDGRRIVEELAQRNAIPAVMLSADAPSRNGSHATATIGEAGSEAMPWLAAATQGIASLLGT
jgi:nucleoside-diphosphate-sugar epimerase